MKKILFMAAIAAAVFSSCSKDSDSAKNGASDKAINFRAVTEKTRASLVGSTAELNNFYVKGAKQGASDFSYMEGSTVTYDGTDWNYSPKKYYPTDGTALNFYAYAPVLDRNMSTDLEFASNDATFGYTVPADQSLATSKAVDLLVASVTGKTDDNASVAFTFDHALSAVMFTAKNLNTTSDLTYVVSKVEITKLKNVGTYTYSSKAWATSGVDVTYNAAILEGGAYLPANTAVKLLSANEYMMVLPQTPATIGTLHADNTVDVDGTFVEVTYAVYDGEGENIEGGVRKLVLPSTFKFELGKRYNFSFEFEGLSTIEFDVTEVNTWTDVVENV